jgi:hypothetical protein
MDKPEAKREWSQSPVYIALALAVVIWVIILFLNWIGPVFIPVSAKQFEQLETAGLIESIQITPAQLQVRLHKQVRVGNEAGESWLTDRVALDKSLDSLFFESDIEGWKTAGISVHFQDDESGNDRRWTGIVLLCGLFGIGIWYMWSQIKTDRSGKGSPRRRLMLLEKELKEGSITQEEYRKKAEEIWPEM